MTYLGAIGALLGLIALRFAFVNPSRTKFALFVAAWLLHIAVTLAYYVSIQDKPADSAHYYFDYAGIFYRDFQLNTWIMVWFVQTLRDLIGGTYLDYFMLFQAFGFWGIALLMRVFEEIWGEVGQEPAWSSYLILFLPGLHFWTAAIGKDAPMFLAIVMALWAAMKLSRRWIWFGIALGLMILIRPYVALLALGSLGVAAMFDPGRTRGQRIALIAAAVIGTGFAASTVQMTFGVDVTDADELGEYVSSRTEVFEAVGGNTAVLNVSYPEKLLSLLYRPFFVDSVDALSLIASLENLLLLLGTIVIAMRWRAAKDVLLSVFFLRFAVVLALLLIILFSVLYYNIGLGLRQKVMFIPLLAAFYVAILAVRRARQAVAVRWRPA